MPHDIGYWICRKYAILNEFPLILCPIRIIYGLNFTFAENTKAQAYGVLLYSVFLQF